MPLPLVSRFQHTRLVAAWLVAIASVTAAAPAVLLAEDAGAEKQKVVFFVLGDPQLHEPFLRGIVARIAAQNPDFLLIPGDCCMANGSDPRPWDRFFDIFAPLYDQPNTRLFAIPGNHDVDGDFTAALENWIDRWDLPGHEIYYSFTRGPVYVAGLFVTNAGLFRSPAKRSPLNWPGNVIDDPKSQIEWLADDLKQLPGSVKWKFLFHHEPGTRYARLSHPFDGPGSAGVSGYVEPLAFDHDVDLIIRGHQHFYQRTYPIDIASGRRDDAHGLAMITTGGGCTAFRPEQAEDAQPLWCDAVIATHRIHYNRVTIEGNHLTWETIDFSGNVFDRFEIIKHADGHREWIGLPPTGKLLPVPEKIMRPE